MDEQKFRGPPPFGEHIARIAPTIMPLDRRLAELSTQLIAAARCRERELVLIGALTELCGELDHGRVMEGTVRAAAALTEAACAGLVLSATTGPRLTPRTWTWAGPEVDGAAAVELEREVIEAVTGSTHAGELDPQPVSLPNGDAPAPAMGQVLMVTARDDLAGRRHAGATDGGVAGWLWVAVPRAGTFDADDAETLTILGRAAGRALAAVHHFAMIRWPGGGRLGLARHGADLLQVTAAGVLLLDRPGAELAAASDDTARGLQLLQLRHAEGPGPDSYHGAWPVLCSDVAGESGRWPRFAPAALAAGYTAVHTLPIRLRDQRLGSMSLFRTTPGGLDAELVELGQAMAEVTAIGILRQRTVRRQEVVAQQLQNALDSRVLIEQAKGILAARLGVGIEDAFGVLREHARTCNRKLLDVAQEVADGVLWIAPRG